IEHDRVELLPAPLELTQQVERIRFPPLDILDAVETRVFGAARERLGALINGDDCFGLAGQMQREGAMIGEEIERPAARARVQPDEQPVLTLINESGGLL